MKQKTPKDTQSTDHANKSKSIFACDSQTTLDLSTEGVKADCMNHGYRILKTLGEGAYAKVKLAEVMASRLARNAAMSDKSELRDGELQVAIKVVSKSSVPKEFLKKFLPREVENHTKMPEHPHVVRVFDNFSTQEHVYLVMEYCKKGDLLDLINKHIGTNQKGIGEELSRNIFRQLCEALQHIHMNGVVHRDLKCENVLLDENMDAKLTDFGFSASIQDPKTLLKTSCGSYAYTAPEVIRNKPYEGFKADVWSLGIVLFAMINGRLPFNDAEMLQMDEDMKMQRLRFERSTSFDCMVLIRKLLQYHPSERPYIDAILNDPWITGKKPIPRQLQRPKWINPYQIKKTEEKEVPVVIHKPLEVVDLPWSMRNNTICYRPASSNKTYTESLAGTVTVNHTAGETVTLKSRSGRAFQRKIDVQTVETRPNTWPKSKEGSPAATKPGNKPRTTNQQNGQNEHKGADIRNIARLITENRQGEMPYNSKDIAKQVPLWLVHQILNSESQQGKEERAKLFPNGVESPKSPPETPVPLPPGCPACGVSSHLNAHRTEKSTENVHRHCQTRTKNTSAGYKNTHSATVKSSHVKSAGHTNSNTTTTKSSHVKSAPSTPRKQMVNYTSPIPVLKDDRNAEQRSTPTESVSPQVKVPFSASPTNVKFSSPGAPPSTKVSSGFKFKVMTPAYRANLCRERKMHAYTNQVFHEVVWPLPLVHGQAVTEDLLRSPSQRKKGSATSRDFGHSVETTNENKKVAIGFTNITPKHKLVVHVCS